MNLSKITSSKDGKAFIKKQADLLVYKEKVASKKQSHLNSEAMNAHAMSSNQDNLSEIDGERRKSNIPNLEGLTVVANIDNIARGPQRQKTMLHKKSPDLKSQVVSGLNLQPESRDHQQSQHSRLSTPKNTPKNKDRFRKVLDSEEPLRERLSTPGGFSSKDDAHQKQDWRKAFRDKKDQRNQANSNGDLMSKFKNSVTEMLKKRMMEQENFNKALQDAQKAENESRAREVIQKIENQKQNLTQHSIFMQEPYRKHQNEKAPQEIKTAKQVSQPQSPQIQKPKAAPAIQKHLKQLEQISKSLRNIQIGVNNEDEEVKKLPSTQSSLLQAKQKEITITTTGSKSQLLANRHLNFLPAIQTNFKTQKISKGSEEATLNQSDEPKSASAASATSTPSQVRNVKRSQFGFQSSKRVSQGMGQVNSPGLQKRPSMHLKNQPTSKKSEKFLEKLKFLDKSMNEMKKNKMYQENKDFIALLKQDDSSKLPQGRLTSQFRDHKDSSLTETDDEKEEDSIDDDELIGQIDVKIQKHSFDAPIPPLTQRDYIVGQSQLDINQSTSAGNLSFQQNLNSKNTQSSMQNLLQTNISQTNLSISSLIGGGEHSRQNLFSKIAEHLIQKQLQQTQQLLQASSQTEVNLDTLNMMVNKQPTALIKPVEKRYANIKAKIETNSPMLSSRPMFFKSKDLIDQAIEKESIKRQNRLSKLQQYTQSSQSQPPKAKDQIVQDFQASEKAQAQVSKQTTQRIQTASDQSDQKMLNDFSKNEGRDRERMQIIESRCSSRSRSRMSSRAENKEQESFISNNNMASSSKPNLELNLQIAIADTPNRYRYSNQSSFNDTQQEFKLNEQPVNQSETVQTPKIVSSIQDKKAKGQQKNLQINKRKSQNGYLKSFDLPSLIKPMTNQSDHNFLSPTQATSAHSFLPVLSKTPKVISSSPSEDQFLKPNLPGSNKFRRGSLKRKSHIVSSKNVQISGMKNDQNGGEKSPDSLSVRFERDIQKFQHDRSNSVVGKSHSVFLTGIQENLNLKKEKSQLSDAQESGLLLSENSQKDQANINQRISLRRGSRRFTRILPHHLENELNQPQDSNKLKKEKQRKEEEEAAAEAAAAAVVADFYHFDLRVNSQQNKRQIKSKINQELKELIGKMNSNDKISKIQIEKKLRQINDPSLKFDFKLLEQVANELDLEKEKSDFNNYRLMIKGLNKEFEEEYRLQKFSDKFERRTYRSQYKINKKQILQHLMTTFTNQSFLNQLKKSNQEMSASLSLIGMNFENYRTLAKSFQSSYVFKNPRTTLIERQEEQREEELNKQLDELIQSQKSSQVQQAIQNLRKVLKPKRTKNMSKTFDERDNKSPKNQNASQESSSEDEEDDEDFKRQEELDRVPELIERQISRFPSQLSKPPLTGFVSKANGKIIESIDDKTFKDMLSQINKSYKAEEPSPTNKFFRAYSRKPSQSFQNSPKPLDKQATRLSGVLSPTSSNGSQNNPPLSPLSARLSKGFKINPRFLMHENTSNPFKAQARRANQNQINSQGASPANSQLSKQGTKKQSPVQHHELSQQKINDQEIQEFSKYVNSLLFKSSDNFIKAKYKQHQRQQEAKQRNLELQKLAKNFPNLSLTQQKSYTKNLDYTRPNLKNFYNRMEQNQKEREFLNVLITEMNETGEVRKLQRLKKLSEVTHIMRKEMESGRLETTQYSTSSDESAHQESKHDDERQKSPSGSRRHSKLHSTLLKKIRGELDRLEEENKARESKAKGKKLSAMIGQQMGQKIKNMLQPSKPSFLSAIGLGALAMLKKEESNKSETTRNSGIESPEYVKEDTNQNFDVARSMSEEIIQPFTRGNRIINLEVTLGRL